MKIEDEEILQIFIEESLEHLSDIENNLLLLEKEGISFDVDILNQIFRAAHSIKGGAGFMGFDNIKDLSHGIENILGMIRNYELSPDPEIINTLLISFDKLTSLIKDINNSNSTDISEYLKNLKKIISTQKYDKKKIKKTSERLEIFLPDGRAIFTISEDKIKIAQKKGKFIYLIEYDLLNDLHEKTLSDFFDEIESCGAILNSKIDFVNINQLKPDNLPEKLPVFLLFSTIIEPDIISTLFDIKNNFIQQVNPKNPPKKAEKKTAKFDLPLPDITEFKHNNGKKLNNTPTAENNTTNTNNSDDYSNNNNQVFDNIFQKQTSLRVNVILLDAMMNFASELVLSRNQLLRAVQLNEHKTLETVSQRINLITSELQESVMRSRMQPINVVFNKFPRIVRDLSIKIGKDIKLVLIGKEVELDKTIIETISDPLTHLVRNSIDHGIELPEERLASGKDIKGKIFIKAYHEAGQVIIEVSDDGKGIDTQKIVQRAIEKGFITEKEAHGLPEKDKTDIIFMPGFSTTENATDISGRGVGMDVVKANIDKLGGIIEVLSQKGEGTTFRVKLPLTLAIIPSLIVSCDKHFFAIPQVNIEELVRIPPQQIQNKLEYIGDAEVLRIRGKIIPILNMKNILNIDTTYFDIKTRTFKQDRRQNLADRRSRKNPYILVEDKNTLKNVSDEEQDRPQRPFVEDRRYHAGSALNIVIVSSGTFKYGLIVDKLFDSEEIVVKPLGQHFKDCKGYAGSTLMGDGKIALILDIANLAIMANLVSMENTLRAHEIANDETLKKSKGAESKTLLVFKNAIDEQFAAHLDMVSRIEKIKASDIEYIGNKKIIQYHGKSIPALSIDNIAEVKPLTIVEDLQIIVFNIEGKEFALLVTPPVDAIETISEIDKDTFKQPGISGSIIIKGQTTLLIDILQLLKALVHEADLTNIKSQPKEKERPSILFAEDSDFFRTQLKTFIEKNGYKTFEAEDGAIAWDILQEQGSDISMVLTDIEMPNLDGYGLTKKIKEDPRFSHLPVLALTALADEEDIKKGEEAGIISYHIKLDKKDLIKAINNVFENIDKNTTQD